jgi:anion-transporting  ArsA/GET3 family ATPase
VSSLRPLLDHRLIVVTGKGGTGKTTVSAAIGLAAARYGLRVMVVEMGRETLIPGLIEAHHGPVGYSGAEVRPDLHVMRIDPFEALSEYLGIQLGMPALVDKVLSFEGFRQLMSAAPGWRELITLGKIWHLERMEEHGGPRYDLIVVDAPATGHGVTFLDVPRVVVSAIRAGPLRSHTERVEELIQDPTRTLLLPVALAEELPTRETVELVEETRARLAVHVDRVVLNAMHAAPFDESLVALPEWLRAIPHESDIGGLPSAETLARCAEHLSSRHRLNERYAAEIEQGTGLPGIRLPYLPSGTRGTKPLATLARALLGDDL